MFAATKLLLAAGTAAAAIASVAPGTHAGSAPVTVGPGGVQVVVAKVSGTTTAKLVVPAGVTQLTGSASGSPALAARTRLVVVRSSDGATLFTGSLATFRSLPVAAGTQLRIEVSKPAGHAGLRASAALRWS